VTTVADLLPAQLVTRIRRRTRRQLYHLRHEVGRELIWRRRQLGWGGRGSREEHLDARRRSSGSCIPDLTDRRTARDWIWILGATSCNRGAGTRRRRVEG
jgi:hypothetical protein